MCVSVCVCLCVLEMCELAGIMNDRWTFVNPLPQKNDVWASGGDRMRNLLMTGETLLPSSYQITDG